MLNFIPQDLQIFCIETLTCAEGRFRPCLPILQNPQQFSDELQNYNLHFTHTHPHTLLTYTDDIHTQSELYTIHDTCVNSRKRVFEPFNSRN